MATLTRVSPSLSSPQPCGAHKISGLVAGEALVAGNPVYIKTDGKVWKANGTAANAAALAVGMVSAPSSVGEACTVWFGVCFNFAAGLTPGARYYVSATAGELDDGATTGGTVPFAIAVDATQIYVLPPVR